MRVLVFGATGMVGQGVLRECLRDPDVELAVTIGRTASGVLADFDACFFCLGVSSSGMNEADYTGVTYDLTMAAAETLSRLNPHMTFIYVSGTGTDSTEKGSTMWARVKGRTENALLRLPFSAFMFRPGFIEPMDGIKSKTPVYRVFYFVLKPLMPLLRWSLPNLVTSTREIGRAMLNVAKHGYRKRILETRDIRTVVNR